MENGAVDDYVAVGLSPEYSVTVEKSTFDTGFILFTLIFVLCLIVFVTVIMVVAININNPKPIPKQLPSGKITPTNNSNYGGVPYESYVINNKYDVPEDASAFVNQQQCSANENTQWVNNKCTCVGAYFGATCQQEKHSSKYYAVGIVDVSVVNASIIDTITSDGKSFNKDSCSSICDRDDRCDGFTYHQPNQCTLISGDVIIPKDSSISYAVDSDATLYMSNPKRLYFEDVIFISANRFELQGRYWLKNKTDKYAQVVPYHVTKINFYPEYISMYTMKTGIYCTHEFTAGDIPDILQYGDMGTCYIHEPGATLNVPALFRGSPIYVTYI